ncbi:MAG: (2Fe-2S)-binding protein [Treponema sp.]|jgi:NADH-quinone oxidoreductase subunit G/NADP-reducing hydrogenase subunit HndD|nr:(2Fe-2S)-binding protein [Treponema sp.]
MSHYAPNPNKSVNLPIDGLPVTVPEDTTILEAARKVNVSIPTLCDYPDLRRRAVCRLCVVECDGRGKLVPACANDVWEGVNVITNNARIIDIRKTIIELMLANHPQDCLACIRNTRCELQSLAERFGIRSSSLNHKANQLPSESANGILVRDMGKCVKCGRCVEVCQEVQTVRAINSSHRSVEYEICTPYGQALTDGPCIFCGQCAVVCPVGAIYGHDQSTELWTILSNGRQNVVAELTPSVTETIAKDFGLKPVTITGGKLVTTLKRMGFNKVFDAGFFSDLAAGEELNELHERIKTNSLSTKPQSARMRLPMLSGCFPGWIKFVKEAYPDLMDHLSSNQSARQLFVSLARKQEQKITSVSILPCIAMKTGTQQLNNEASPNPDFTLTAQELARLVRLAGIDFSQMPESPFDTITVKNDMQRGTSAPTDFGAGSETGTTDNINEKTLVVNGLGNARIIMDAIRKGNCDAALVKIMCCPTCFTGAGCSAAGCTIDGAKKP